MACCGGGSLSLEGVEFNHDAPPLEQDREQHEANAVLLKQCPEVLDQLRNIPSGVELTTLAVNSAELKPKWEALDTLTNINVTVHRFYVLGQNVADALVKIVETLCATIDENNNQAKSDPLHDIEFDKHGALVMDAIRFLSFMIQFDTLKSMHASIQNDLSMYKRLREVPKTLNGDYSGEEAEYAERLRNWKRPEELEPNTVASMSFFVASPYPMMGHAIAKHIALAASDPRVDLILPELPNLILILLNERRFGDTSVENKTCIEAMICAIVIADRVEPEGIFHRKSRVQISECIDTVKRYPSQFSGDAEADCDQLMNALRYWTCHLQDATTQKKVIKQMGL